MNLNHNETEFFSTWSLDDSRASDIKTALTAINKKLNDITRDVSFWDVYNVTQVLLNDNDLTSKLALLNIGEAAIVNANVLNNGAENHYRGDIAYRKADGELIWIDAENKGIYKPSITYDTQKKMLQVTYSYQSNTPSEGESQTIAMDASQQTGYSVDKKTTEFDTETVDDQSVYTLVFPTLMTTSGFLKPLVKFLIEDGSNGYEEFYPDYKWKRGDYEVVTGTDEHGSPVTETIDGIKVTIYFQNSKVFMRVR